MEEMMNKSMRSKNTNRCLSHGSVTNNNKKMCLEDQFRSHIRHLMMEKFGNSDNKDEPFKEIKFLNCNKQLSELDRNEQFQAVHHRPRDCIHLDNCSLVSKFSSHVQEAKFIRE